MKKRFYALVCICASVFASAMAQDGEEQPIRETYTIDFLSSPDGWTSHDGDGDGKTWATDEYSMYVASYCNPSGTDDWFASPKFHFVEGESYTVNAVFNTFFGLNISPVGAPVYVMFGDWAYTPETVLCQPAALMMTKDGMAANTTFTATVTGDFSISLLNRIADNEMADVYCMSFSIEGPEGMVSGVGTGGGDVGGDEPSLAELPYSIDFSRSNDGWTGWDGDGDGNTWGEINGYFGASKCNTTGATNDWFVSPKFHFVEGNEYEVIFYAYADDYAEPDYYYRQVALMFGDQNYTPQVKLTETAQTQIHPSSINYEIKANFTSEVTGDYSMSLVNVTSQAPMGSVIKVKSFSIECTKGDQPAETITLPYTQSFMTDLGDWTTFDANGDNTTWTSFGSGAFCYSYMNSNDDYLISPEIAFTPGNYEITVSKTYMMPGESDNIEVYVGTGNDVSAYEKVGALDMATSVTEDVIPFTIGEAGNYKVALRNLCSVYSTWYITEVTIDYGEAAEPAVLLDRNFVEDSDISDWTVIDVNSDGAWQGSDGAGVVLSMSYTQPQDDWIISPALSLSAGKSYIVSYTLNSTGGFEPETMEVALGTAATADAMTEIIANESFQGEISSYYRITPETAGNYYLGFHATSPVFNGSLFLLSVKVEASDGVIPVAPSDFTAVSDIQAGTVTLGWTNPTIDTENVAISQEQDVTIRIMRNGEQVEEVTGKAGEAMSYVDSPVPFEGTATYEIYAYCETEKLSTPAAVTLDLEDFNGERTLLYNWGGVGNGSFEEWTIENVDGYQTYEYQSWDNSMKLATKSTRDDWMITPAMALSAERRYVVEIDVKASEQWSSYFEIYIGSEAQSIFMERKVLDVEAVGNGTITYTSEQFGLDISSDYYIGVRCTGTQNQTFINGFRVYYYDNGASGAVEVPYEETFDSGSLSGWSMPAATTFEVLDGALTSNATGAERNETVYSPLINMKAGYTYEVTFIYANYSLAGAEGCTFAFSMASGQSEAELIADSRVELATTETSYRYLFTPTEDGTYCAVWQLVADADYDATVSIDNVRIGAKVYAALPYSEDFNSYELGETPVGYTGATVTSDIDNIAIGLDAEASTPWFMQERLRDTYSISFKVKSDAELTVNVFNGIETKTVGTVEASSDWTEQSFLIPAFEADDTYDFRIMFETAGSVMLDDIEVALNERDIYAAAPVDFRAFLTFDETGLNLYWNYPTVDVDGYVLEDDVTVTVMCGDKEIATATGAPGTMASLSSVPIDGSEWVNDVMILRAVSMVGDVQGNAVTDVLYPTVDRIVNQIAEFDMSDEAWVAEGWTFADGAYTATGEGTATLTSPAVTLTEGSIYMVRYSIITDADAPADFSVTVNGETQSFADTYLGTDSYTGEYPYIDFILSRIETTGDYNVTIAASNIGESVSVNGVSVYEVREYPAICDMPYENDFDDEAVATGRIEPNWSIPRSTMPWIIDETSKYGVEAASGSRALVAPVVEVKNRIDFVYTPKFNCEIGKYYKIEFDYYKPSDAAGLALVWAYDPTYEEGDYATIVELATEADWTHYEYQFEGIDNANAITFGFLAFCGETFSDKIVAVDNFKISEVEGSSVDGLAGMASVYYCNGILNIPADIANTAIYDVQGRMVMFTEETGGVSLDGLECGVYVVKAVGHDGSAQTLKIVK